VPRISRTRHHRETIEFRGAARAVGRIVRALRLDRGWTVEQAAGHFGIEPAFVRRIESGRTNPSLAILVSIARAFATSLGGLVSRGRSGKGAR
jgi:transcriptional regulator with XRE-family HTH domain